MEVKGLRVQQFGAVMSDTCEDSQISGLMKILAPRNKNTSLVLSREQGNILPVYIYI